MSLLSRRKCCCGEAGGCEILYRSGEDVIPCVMPGGDLYVSSPWGATTLALRPAGGWKGFLNVTTTGNWVATSFSPTPGPFQCSGVTHSNQLLLELNVGCHAAAPPPGRPSSLLVSTHALMILSSSQLIASTVIGGELVPDVAVPPACVVSRTWMDPSQRFAAITSCSPLLATSSIIYGGAYSGILTITS